MEYISSDLLTRLQQSMQTIGNDANPHMDVISQRAAKYINQGTYLAPQTVRTGDSLARLDVTARREDKDEEPTEFVMIYIENDLAKVATLPYVHTPDDLWEYQYTIGPATDVACDFDGRFRHIDSHTGLYFDTSVVWALESIGEPYYAVVNNGALVIYHDEDDPFTLVSENVTRVSLLRGWKSITDILIDQGLICAYVKTDGNVYYRNYCEQEDGSYIWENERQVMEFDALTVTDLALFRTNDYRFGFIVESAGTMTWAITDRYWSGMAWPPEYLTAHTSMTVDVYEINYYDGFEDDHISAEASMTVTVLWGISPIFTAAENIANGDDDYGYLVRLTFDHDILNVADNDTAFLMEDESETLFNSTSVTQISARIIEVTFQNFNNAIGDVVVAYTPGTMLGEAGQVVEADTILFTPTNLVPFAVDPPVPVSIENIIDWSVT